MILRRLVAAAIGLALPLVLTPPASALAVPPMRVVVQPDTARLGFHACGAGTSTSAIHSWTLTVEGSRSNGTIFRTLSGSGATFDDCIYVSKAAAPAGTFTVTLDYVGVGLDVTGHFVGGAYWIPGDEFTFATGIG